MLREWKEFSRETRDCVKQAQVQCEVSRCCLCLYREIVMVREEQEGDGRDSGWRCCAIQSCRANGQCGRMHRWTIGPSNSSILLFLH